jgi:hypothetical protein
MQQQMQLGRTGLELPRNQLQPRNHPHRHQQQQQQQDTRAQLSMVLLAPGAEQQGQGQATGDLLQQQQQQGVVAMRRRLVWTSGLARGWGGAQGAARMVKDLPVKVSSGQ